MKRSIVFILFFSAFSGNAQEKPLRKFDNKLLPEIPRGKVENIFINRSPLKLLPPATLLYQTEKGAVYQLPVDNMPCVVITINSKMPVLKTGIKDLRKMPNAYPEQNIIPEGTK